MSLKAWKFFKAFLKEHGSNGESLPDGFQCFIRTPTASDFNIYIEPLRSTAVFGHVSHVRICGQSQIGAHDLIHLTSLNNLGILEIMEPLDQTLPFPRVTDRLMRTWSEQPDPFPSLKVLRIQSLGLTDRSLRYLSTLNQLCLFEATAQPRNWRSSHFLATDFDWVPCDLYQDYKRSRKRRDSGGYGHACYSPDAGAMLLELTETIEKYRRISSTRGRLGRLNWMYWLYNGLHKTPLRIDGEATGKVLGAKSAEETYTLTKLERPIVTLTLGHDNVARQPNEHLRQIYFWRYWLPDGETMPTSMANAILEPRDGYTRHPRPAPPPPPPALEKSTGTNTPTKNAAAPKLKRRRQQGADYFADLLGHDGRGAQTKRKSSS